MGDGTPKWSFRTLKWEMEPPIGDETPNRALGPQNRALGPQNGTPGPLNGGWDPKMGRWDPHHRQQPLHGVPPRLPKTQRLPRPGVLKWGGGERDYSQN